MAEVVWTDFALANLEAITSYVAAFSPKASRRLNARLVEVATSLESNPMRGRSAKRGRRELTIVAPYLLRFRIDGDRVIILEIRHGVRRPN